MAAHSLQRSRKTSIRYGCSIALAALAAIAPSHADEASQAAALHGQWLTASGNLVIEIAPCGTALCGKVVQVLANRSMERPKETMRQSDSRPVLGLTILSELARSGDGEWEGRIYNRENGKTYDCRVVQTAPGEISVRGYRVLPLFGQTQVWTRVAPTAGH